MKHTQLLLTGFAVGLIAAFTPACTPVSTCDDTSCPTGCCDANGECQVGKAQACGSGGNACTACAFGQTCNSGFCFDGNNGGGSGVTTGGGVGTTGGGVGTTGGGVGTSGGGVGTTGGGVGTTGGGVGTSGGGDGTTGGGVGTTGGGVGTTGGGVGTTGGGVGTSGGGVGTSGGGVGTTGGGVGTTGGGVGTTGGGVGTTGGGVGTTGGGTGTTGGGTGTLQPIAGACTTNANCQSGLSCKTTRAADNVSTFPSGYCSKSCTATTDCDANGFCVTDTAVLALYLDSNICLGGTCTVTEPPTAGGCRTGYVCAGDVGTPGFCIPETFPQIIGGAANKVGQTCTADTQCQTPPDHGLGLCFEQMNGTTNTGWLGGACTAVCNYDLRGDFCGTGSGCLLWNDTPGSELSLCMPNCTAPNTQSNCRSGYICLTAQNSQGTNENFCLPNDCRVLGCPTTQTCNTTTGQCQ